MKGKKKVIIGIIAAVVVVGIVVAVVLGMRRGKSDKTINVGNATESDEMSSWRTDGHRVAKAESGYYYLEWSDTDSTTTAAIIPIITFFLPFICRPLFQFMIIIIVLSIMY